MFFFSDVGAVDVVLVLPILVWLIFELMMLNVDTSAAAPFGARRCAAARAGSASPTGIVRDCFRMVTCFAECRTAVGSSLPCIHWTLNSVTCQLFVGSLECL